MKTASAARPPKPLRAGLIRSVVFSPAVSMALLHPWPCLPAISMGEVAWPRSAGRRRSSRPSHREAQPRVVTVTEAAAHLSLHAGSISGTPRALASSFVDISEHIWIAR